MWGRLQRLMRRGQGGCYVLSALGEAVSYTRVIPIDGTVPRESRRQGDIICLVLPVRSLLLTMETNAWIP